MGIPEKIDDTVYPSSVAIEAFNEAFGDWSRACTLHWSVAQRMIDGERPALGQLEAATAEFEAAHRRLIEAVDRL
jgi:hypothetical protein